MDQLVKQRRKLAAILLSAGLVASAATGIIADAGATESALVAVSQVGGGAIDAPVGDEKPNDPPPSPTKRIARGSIMHDPILIG